MLNEIGDRVVHGYLRVGVLVLIQTGRILLGEHVHPCAIILTDTGNIVFVYKSIDNRFVLNFFGFFCLLLEL